MLVESFSILKHIRLSQAHSIKEAFGQICRSARAAQNAGIADMLLHKSTDVVIQGLLGCGIIPELSHC
jgi:hypothetical protein